MGKWKFTATTQDIAGKSTDRITGEVSGPDPSEAREAVRQRVKGETSAWRVDVDVDAPEFD